MLIVLIDKQKLGQMLEQTMHVASAWLLWLPSRAVKLSNSPIKKASINKTLCTQRPVLYTPYSKYGESVIIHVWTYI